MTSSAPVNKKTDSFSLSKKFRFSVLLPCLLWTGWMMNGSPLRADTYNIGDSNNLYLGFYSADAVSTKSLLINLGNRANVISGFNLDFSSASSIIAQTYGSGWFSSADVYWSVIGYSANANVWSGKADAAGDLQSTALGATTLSGSKYSSIVTAFNNLMVTSTEAGATRASATSGTNSYGISIVDNSASSFSGYAGKASPWNAFTQSVITPLATGGLDIQEWTKSGSSYINQTAIGMVMQSGGIISISGILSNTPGSYPGPWNWTAGSGNWDVTNNWTSNQVASNSYAVGITGSGGTITNNAVTNLSSITFSNSAGSYTLAGTQTLTISGGITNNSTAMQTIDLSIEGAGGLAQLGSGTTVLGRSNSYSGGTTLSNGAVEIRNNNALGSGAVTVSGASSLIAGTSNLSTTNAMALNATTTIDTAANRWTNAGTLSGNGALSKIGSGSLTIAGTGSTFNGNTALNAGTLQVAAGSSLGSGTVNVASGSTLSGSGTVGGVTLSSGGILTGGVDGAMGKLTVSGDMTLSAGGMLNWKLGNASGLPGTGFDSFDVRGTLDLTGLTTGSTLQFNILNALGGTTGFKNYENSEYLVAKANSITGFSTNDFTISTNGFSNMLGGGSFSFSTNGVSGLGLYLVFTALGVDPWTGNIAAGSQSISGQIITSASNAVIGANTSRNGSVAVTNSGAWNVQGNLQVGGSTNGSGTLTIGSGGRITANNLTISDLKGSRGLVLVTNGASQNAISLGSGTLSFGAGNGTLQFAQSNAVTLSNAITGKGTVSSTGTGTTTLSGNQSGFIGTNYLSSGSVVLATGATNAGIVNIAGKNASFNLNTNAVLSSTGTHAVAGTLLDNSGLAFRDSIKGSVALSPTGVLQKTYATNQSVAGFGAGIGSGKSFSILAGTAASNGTNAPTLQAKIVKGQLDFHGTTSNAIVMQMKDPSYSSIRNQIQWFDPVSKSWKNTTAGNTGNITNSAISGMNGTSFVGSFDKFLLSVNTNSLLNWGDDLKLVDRQNEGVLGSLLDELNLRGAGINTYLAKIMGAFGYDNATKTSWAVINHNSIFGDGSATFTSADLLNEAVVADLSVFNPAPVDVQAVPEPETWTLMVFGVTALYLMYGLRRRTPDHY